MVVRLTGPRPPQMSRKRRSTMPACCPLTRCSVITSTRFRIQIPSQRCKACCLSLDDSRTGRSALCAKRASLQRGSTLLWCHLRASGVTLRVNLGLDGTESVSLGRFSGKKMVCAEQRRPKSDAKPSGHDPCNAGNCPFVAVVSSHTPSGTNTDKALTIGMIFF